MASAGGAGRGGGKRDGGKGEGSLVRRAWRQYLLQLQQHPLRTKMITAGCLAGVSDSVAQKLSGEAFEGGDDQGKETIPFCAIERLDVLADSWLDKPSVHAFTIPSDLPQRCRMLLGDIYEPSCEGHVSEAGVDGLEGRNSSIAPTRYQIK